MKRIALAVAILIGLATPSQADFQAGLAAYNRGDYTTALQEFKPLAEQGIAEAQFNLGLMYDKGQGVPQDYAEAVKWYRKAAEQGYARAQNNLGLMYSKGRGVPQDYAEALKWYRKAAEQGRAKAQFNLGLMYDEGQGVPQDYAEALKWYRKAAAQGLASAQYNLGVMYSKGQGVLQPAQKEVRARHILVRTEEEAVSLIAELNKGADFAATARKNSIGPSAAQGGDLGYFSRDQMVAAFAEAAFSLGKGEMTQTPVQTRFGWHIIVVEDIRKAQPPSFEEKKYAEAVKWYRKAAEQGLAKAQFSLGLMYSKGQGVPQDYAEAVKWYRKAAEQGNAYAQNNLGFMYEKGRGVPRDLVQAYAWFNLGAARHAPGPDRQRAVRNRDRVAGQLSPRQLTRAQQLARHWDRNPASVGNLFADPVHPPQIEPSRPRSERVASVQRALAALGNDPGPADGVLGPKTRAAIRSFEADHDLPITGTVSEELNRALFLAQIKRGLQGRRTESAAEPEKPTKGSGLGRADVFRDASPMSAWVAKISGVYNELFQVIKYAGQVDEVSGALIDGEISKDYALRNGRYFILQARLSYKKGSREIDCCLSQPKFKTETFTKSARNLAQYIRTLRDQVRDIIENTEATFSAAIAEDADTVRRLQLKAFEQSIILINAENVILNTQKLLIKESHPGYSFLLVVISGNKAIVAMLSYLRDFASGRLAAADIDASRLLVEQELLKLERAINDGRQATLSLRVQISTMRPKTERDRHLVTALGQAVDTFKETFDIEEELLSTISSLADTLLTPGLENASLELWETEWLKIEVLIDQRLQLQSNRARLLGEMGDR